MDLEVRAAGLADASHVGCERESERGNAGWQPVFWPGLWEEWSCPSLG